MKKLPKPLECAFHDDVRIVPCQVEWLRRFRLTKQLIIVLLEDDIECYVRHVGGTAIPGMCGKPIVDVPVLVEPENITTSTHRESKPCGERNAQTAAGETNLWMAERDDLTILRGSQGKSRPALCAHAWNAEHAGTMFSDSGGAKIKRLVASFYRALQVFLTFYPCACI